MDNKTVFCFVGVDNRPIEQIDDMKLMLTSGKSHQFPVRASCFVSLIDGTVTEIELVKPKGRRKVVVG